MMYGGVAQTYCRWEMIGEPYKKGNALYVKMKNPITKSPKEVRFYTDKKHAELMPAKENLYGPFYKIFGFESEEDYIFCVKKRDITDDEEQEYFAHNWRFGMFFGGVWYAPKDKELPPIGKKDKIFKATWAEFRKAGQENSKKIQIVPENESPWFK